MPELPEVETTCRGISPQLAGATLRAVTIRVDIDLGQTVLRYRDPRRFGAMLWQQGPADAHPLLASLGPEPLSDAFDGNVLYQATRRKGSAIKLVIMDNHVVVGVGNIYANESLFYAGLHPARSANSLSRDECQRLAAQIKLVLARAIDAGGSSLRDFMDAKGKPGYFQQSYKVYGDCRATPRAAQQLLLPALPTPLTRTHTCTPLLPYPFARYAWRAWPCICAAASLPSAPATPGYRNLPVR